MLSPAETEQLHRLAIEGSASPLAAASGRHVSRTRAFNAEFHEFRAYQPGDDLRSIDWTVASRLRQLVVRTGRADGPVTLHLLVDTSLSMSIGTPSKLTCAAKLAGALSYLAVARRDPVGVATFDDDVRVYLPPKGGRPQLFRVFEILQVLTAGGRSAADRAIMNFANLRRGPGVVVIISDFFQSGEIGEALEYLIFRGLTPAVVQVVADEELAPVIDGEVELGDIEDPSQEPVVVDAAAIAPYLVEMERLSASLRAFGTAHRAPSLRLRSSLSFNDLLTSALQAGLIEFHG